MTLTYDRAGRPKTITDGSGVRTLAYHVSGQLEDENYASGLLSGFVVDRSFDSLQRPSGISVPSVSSVSYSYDAASRLAVLTFGANTATYGYITNSPLVETITLKNSGPTRLTTTKVYDKLNRLSSISSAPSAASALSYAYTYNSANQRSRVTREDNGYWSHAFDALGQVTSGKKYLAGAIPVSGQDFAWTFDDIGNRKTSTINGALSTYSPTALNQYADRTVPGVIDVTGAAGSLATVTVAVNGGPPQSTTRQGDLFHRQVTLSNTSAAQNAQLTITGVRNLVGPNGEDAVAAVTKTAFLPQTPEAFSHDTDGNLTADARWAYAWDGENRLIATETSATAVAAGVARQKLEFMYDGQGRRIAKKVSTWSGSAWTLASHTLFAHDGWNLLAELNGLAGNAVICAYVWGLDLSGTFQGASGVGGLLFSTLSGQTADYGHACDGNGNVVALVDMATGGKTATYDYHAFGETVQIDGPAAALNPFRFSTKYQDAETGLYYYGYRYYDPGTGRWLSRDPIEEGGGINLYGFVYNNPVSAVDPLGLALEPYNGDPLTMKLRANPRMPESIERIGEGGEAGIGWPLDIAFVYGKCVTIRGRLVLAPTYRSWQITDPEAEGSDRFGQTVGQHERYHGLYAKNEWNANLSRVNYWEGCYCTEKCADLAASIAQAQNRAAFWRQAGIQTEYDKKAYAEGTGLENKYNLLGIQAAAKARSAEQDAQRLIREFISTAQCSRPTKK